LTVDENIPLTVPEFWALELDQAAVYSMVIESLTFTNPNNFEACKNRIIFQFTSVNKTQNQQVTLYSWKTKRALWGPPGRTDPLIALSRRWMREYKWNLASIFFLID
jgi:hypothetical protein